ncbi:autotransporter-associated beta strand repeat-containing protein, partial [Enterobacter hormaechei]
SLGGNQTIGALSGIAGSTVTLGSSTLTFGDATNQTFAGVIGGTGGLIKQGTGVQTLSGANTFSGGVNLTAGGLLLGDSSAIGSGALTVSGNG